MSLIVNDSAAIDRENRPNQIMVICGSDAGPVIEDTRNDPAWADWWDRYTGPDMEQAPDPTATLVEQIAALTDAVDMLILDSLGGFDV